MPPKNNKEPKSTPQTPHSTNKNVSSCGSGSQKRKDQKDDNNSTRKQRVFINRANAITKTPTSKSASQPQQQQIQINSVNYLGPQIPEDVMENVLFRFLYNIPENEKNDHIRVCFHIELAHWFYLDFYCTDDLQPPVESCKKVGFSQFSRQVFFKCDYLEKWRSIVDKIVDDFRQYKSNVPTYGVIMLDPTLNYILLVQGYYASKNSWGFPKGKINEGELPVECAIREAFEEVGFDAKDNITSKIRPLQCFIGETLVGLYLATDIPMDYPFKPHLRKEIRKISWFSVWDLPRDRNDDKSCARLGLQPNNFYSILPFINKIYDFIIKEQASRAKGPKCSALKQESGHSENSAFQPVIPRASSQQQIFKPTPNTSTQDLQQYTISSTEAEPSTSGNIKSAVENLFKPLNVEPENQAISFTGQTFLEQFKKLASPVLASTSSNSSNDKEQQIPKNPAGVIGAESRRRNKDIKQPKPLHPSKLILNVYEAPPEQQQQQQKSLFESPQKKIKTLVTTTTPETTIMIDTASGGNTGGNEIVNMLRSSIRKEPTEPAAPTATVSSVSESSQKQQLQSQQCTKVQQQLVPTQVHLCEAWKKFTFDRTRLQQLYASY